MRVRVCIKGLVDKMLLFDFESVHIHMYRCGVI